MTIPESAVRQCVEDLVASVENPMALNDAGYQLLQDGYRQLIEDVIPHDLAVIQRVMAKYFPVS